MLDYSREFVVLASHLNFTTAAEELHISQPGLSRHIAELEKIVGVQLLRRNPVELTPAGSAYLNGIMPVIESLDNVLAQTKLIGRKSKEKVVIRKPPLEGRATQICIDALERARERDPYVEFCFEESRAVSTLDALVSGRADVGFVYDDIPDVPEGIVCEFLFEEPFHMWVHRNNPLARTQPLYFSDLKDLFLVCSANRRCEEWNAGVREVYRRNGIEPRYRVKDLNDLSDFLHTLQEDETVMGSPIFVSLAALSPSIVSPPLSDDPPLCYPTYLLYRLCAPDSPEDHLVQAVRDSVQDILAS